MGIVMWDVKILCTDSINFHSSYTAKAMAILYAMGLALAEK